MNGYTRLCAALSRLSLGLAVIGLLAEYGIEGRARREAPGVYVGDAKIAALGLRVRKGCSYHGLSLNVSPDLAAFGRINPCGYAGLAVTRLADLVKPGADVSRGAVEQRLEAGLRRAFGYDPATRPAQNVPPGLLDHHHAG